MRGGVHKTVNTSERKGDGAVLAVAFSATHDLDRLIDALALAVARQDRASNDTHR